MFIGNSELAIKGYSNVNICLKTAIGEQFVLGLKNTAFIPGIATNLVSLHLLQAQGI